MIKVVDRRWNERNWSNMHSIEMEKDVGDEKIANVDWT